MTLSIELSHDPRTLEQLQAEWETLHAASAADSIYLTWDWITLWWAHFGHQGELWLLQARDDRGQLVGLAPLMCRAQRALRGMIWRQIEFIGASSSVEHLDFILKPGYEAVALAGFMARLQAEQSRWDVLHFNRLLEHSPTLTLLQADAAAVWQDELDRIAPVIYLDEDWETFFQQRLSHGKRKEQRRFRRALDSAYPDWVWRRVTDPDELPRALDELIALHQAFWTSQGEPGAFFGPHAAFHHAVARRFGERGWLELARLELGGELAGSLYGFQYRGRFYDFVSGMDYRFGELRPGHILTEMSLRHAIACGVREYDFLWGQEEYKYRWGAEDRRNVGLCWRASARARLMNGAVITARAGWQLAKRALPSPWRDRVRQAAGG